MAKTRSLLFPLLIIITGTTIFAFFFFRPKITTTSRLEAEREIYSVLFTYLISPERIIQAEEYPLIEEYTTLGEAEGCAAEECAQYIIDSLPKVKQTTLTDFQ